MLFIEKKNLIKADYSKHSAYIAAFNLDNGKERSFFLNSNDWDEFTNYMAEKAPGILVTLEYSPKED